MPIHDTIVVKQVIYDTVFIKGADALNILDKTDAFYNSSWNKLVIVISIAFGVLGLLLPLVVLYIENKSSKLLELKLQKKISIAVENAEVSLNKMIREGLHKNILATGGNVTFLQGRIFSNEEKYYDALKSYTKSITLYLMNDELFQFIPATTDGILWALRDLIEIKKNYESLDEKQKEDFKTQVYLIKSDESDIIPILETLRKNTKDDKTKDFLSTINVLWKELFDEKK